MTTSEFLMSFALFILRTLGVLKLAVLPPPSAGREVVAAVDAAAAHFAGEAGRRAGLGFFFLEQRGVAVFEILQLHARNFLADEAFNGEHMRRILGNHDGERVARG